MEHRTCIPLSWLLALRALQEEEQHWCSRSVGNALLKYSEMRCILLGAQSPDSLVLLPSTFNMPA